MDFEVHDQMLQQTNLLQAELEAVELLQESLSSNPELFLGY